MEGDCSTGQIPQRAVVPMEEEKEEEECYLTVTDDRREENPVRMRIFYTFYSAFHCF
jgi:hypothetical protein